VGRIEIQSFRVKKNAKKILWIKEKGIREHKGLALLIQRKLCASKII